jgi:hypothetical protein
LRVLVRSRTRLVRLSQAGADIRWFRHPCCPPYSRLFNSRSGQFGQLESPRKVSCGVGHWGPTGVK